MPTVFSRLNFAPTHKPDDELKNVPVYRPLTRTIHSLNSEAIVHWDGSGLSGYSLSE
ncbi:hypothetical protein CC2G_003581 [Coprinopsis cinerea AmutBmut pab1-1]|nr:hypothetical protein CC2G_003581 [Coprinopsis cinerea AmutBmut pab1-1]